jgi:type IV pilus assembly protein PilN
MIKINLLSVERHRPVATRKKFTFEIGQKLTILCSLMLIAAVLLTGWRYWMLRGESARLDADIATAQQEATRLRAVIAQVQQFEARKTQLEQRVALIEQLRRDQAGPVHMLDQVSRAMPPMLWLTGLKQGADATEIVLDGRCTTMTGLSDFVSNLEASGYFKRSIEIVSSQAEMVGTPPVELIRFSLKAIFTQGPTDAPTPTAAPGAATAPAPAGASG